MFVNMLREFLTSQISRPVQGEPVISASMRHRLDTGLSAMTANETSSLADHPITID
jgi:hypothetical protein